MAQNSASNPFKDLNKDGVLDGKEILKALENEEQLDFIRTPDERAHGVLQVAEAETLTQTWNQIAVMVANGDLFYSRLEEFKERIATRFEQRLMQRYEQFTQMDSKFVDAYCEAQKPMDNGDLKCADMKSFDAFAKNLKADFPKGVKVAPEDILPILNHFGQIAIPIPPNPKGKIDSGKQI